MRRPAARILSALAYASISLAALALAAPGAYAQEARLGPKANYEAGMFLLSSGDPYRATDAFQAALSANPSYADAWAGLARCQYELGEYERAIAHLGKAYSFGPRAPALVALEGFCHIGLGRLADARKAFDEALAKTPNDRDARFGLALLDLRDGRVVDARARLSASLKASPSDSRALLSMAMIADLEGRDAEAAAYLAEALRWMAGDADAYYAAAALVASKGDASSDMSEAARLARLAVEARPGHKAARSLLASLYFASGARDEARSVLQGSLESDRDDARAWFLLGLVESASGRRSEAEYAFNALLDQRPDDELARLALEHLTMDSTKFEDPSRAELAAWRFARAADFERRLLFDKALAEYRRGLAIDPYSARGRRGYAELLRGSGLPVAYLAELRFLKELGSKDQSVLDAIEAFDRMLEGSVARDWGAESLRIASKPFSVAVFAAGGGDMPWHAGGDAVIARYLRDTLAMRPGILPGRDVSSVFGSSDAYRLSREAGADWFALVSAAETDRDIVVSVELRSGRTGALALKVDAPRAGNDRVALAVASAVESIAAAIPLRGAVVARKADEVLIDLGRVDGVKAGDSFLVIRGGAAIVNPDGTALSWTEADVVGAVKVASLDDEFFVGRIERVGFFDRVNLRDSVVRMPPKIDPSPADPKKKPKAAPEPAPPVSSPVWAALFERVRGLY